jgi:biopolymer transport protein ExbB
MIGLLGTLKGMIGSFSAIAMSGAALDAAQVADGISEALVLTFEGVAVSVPAIYFYSLFKNRISRIAIDTMAKASEQLKSVARGIKGTTGATAPAKVPGAV